MQAVLVMFRSDGERRSFSLARDMTVIGRREDCDLRIPLGEISRKHCRIVRDGDSLRLEDLGSSNGTYHNGERIQEAILNPGDSVQIGPVVFVLQIDGVPSDEELQPVTEQDIIAANLNEPSLEPTGPLSPTAQSEVGQDQELEVLPAESVEEFEPLELPDDEEEQSVSPMPEPTAFTEAEPAGEAESDEPLLLSDPEGETESEGTEGSLHIDVGEADAQQHQHPQHG